MLGGKPDDIFISYDGNGEILSIPAVTKEDHKQEVLKLEIFKTVGPENLYLILCSFRPHTSEKI